MVVRTQSGEFSGSTLSSEEIPFLEGEGFLQLSGEVLEVCLPFPLTIFLFLCKYGSGSEEKHTPLVISSDMDWSYSWKFTEPRGKGMLFKNRYLPIGFYFFFGVGGYILVRFRKRERGVDISHF